MSAINLKRFLDAQDHDYSQALTEIKAGQKRSHWMWYIFPQVYGLGFSEMSKRFAIRNLEEAKDYLNHPILGKRLIEITKVLLGSTSSNATQIMGRPDDVKLRSCMTLFATLPGSDPVFEAVLLKYFDGKKDPATLELL